MESDILIAGATIFVGGLLACLLPAGMRVVRRFWRGPERQIRGALVHTKTQLMTALRYFSAKTDVLPRHRPRGEKFSVFSLVSLLKNY